MFAVAFTCMITEYIFKSVTKNKIPLKRKIIKPDNYKKMVQIAEILAADFPCARIDLYNQNGQIIFGEITFFDSSGYMIFDPDDFDFKLGEKFILPPKIMKL